MPPRPAPDETVVLHDPLVPLFGRDTERAAILNHAAWVASAGQPRFLTVLGEQGSGKSRLVADSLVWIQRRFQARILRVRPRDAALSLWTELTGLLDRAGPPADRKHHKLRGPVPAAVLDVLAATGLDAGQLEGLLGRPPEAILRAVFPLLLERIEQQTGQGLTVAVLSDLHAADSASLDMAEFLAGALADVPLLCIAQARPQLASRRPGWMAGRPAHAWLRLGPLSPEAARALARRGLGGAAPEAMVDRLAALASGNPLLVTQLCRSLHRTDGTALPPELEPILDARLRKVPGRLLPLLQAAAVLGEDVSQDGLRRLAGTDWTAEDLCSLVDDGLLAEAEQGPEYAWPHLAERVLEAMPAKCRAARHMDAAQWLQDRGRASAAVAHYHAAGAPEQAATLRLHLAGEAADRGLLADALDLLEAALPGLPPEQAGPARKFAARTALHLGRVDDALAHMDAHGAATTGDPELVDLRARCLESMGRLEEALRVLQGGAPERTPRKRTLAEGWVLLALGRTTQARAVAATAGRGAAGYDTASLLGAVALHDGRSLEAVDHFERAMQAARAIGDPLAESRALSNLAAALHRAGNLEASLDAGAAALALEEALGDLHAQTGSLVNLANTALRLHRYDRALVLAEHAVSLAHRNGLTALRGLALLTLAMVARRLDRIQGALRKLAMALPLIQEDRRNRGLACSQQGALLTRVSPGQAGPCLDAALTLFLEAEDAPGALEVRLRRVDLLLVRDDREGARRQVDECLSEARDLGLAGLLAKAWLLWGQTREAERPAEALDAYGRAVELAQGHGLHELLWKVHARRSSCLASTGRADEARLAMDQARAVVAGIAQGLSDPQIRSCYLRHSALKDIL